MARILINDDDQAICQILAALVNGMGHSASVAYTLEHGLTLAMSRDYDIILLDLQFPRGNGLQILPDLLNAPSKPEVIIITGSGVHGAELAFKYKAWDYVRKPFLNEEISLCISRALQYRQEKISDKTPITLNRSGIIGSSPGICGCLDSVAKASITDANVLITGETGTGKELFARAIHAHSRRSSKNFIAVDCGALSETLVESILFGHEKGAFTSADRRHEGLFEQTDGGTLFLDEIGDLPFGIQKSLLRVLQEKYIRPLGAKQELRVDFRIVAATNRNLEKMVAENTFREDLLFRIQCIEIKLPPLRDRKDDIPEIIIQMIQRLCRQYGMGIKGISQEFLEILKNQSWPGNVRELINVLECALASAGQDPTLIPKHIPHQYRIASLMNDSSTADMPRQDPESEITVESELKQLSAYRAYHWNILEKQYLQALLQKARGDRAKACALAGISQSQLYALLKKHDLPRLK